MNDEQQLRAGLREFADLVPTGPAPVAELVRRGTAMRRRGRLVRGAIGTAAVVCSVLVVVGLGHPGAQPGPSTTPLPAEVSRPPSTPSIGSSPGTPTSPSSPSVPPVRTVAPRERVVTGGGEVMWLTAQGQHVIERLPAPGETSPVVPETRNVLDGNQGFGVINVRTFGRRDGALYTGAVRYRGTSAPVRVTVDAAGRTFDAHVLTLGGSPGWAVYYLDGPVVPRNGSSLPVGGGGVTVVAYAADGTVLATASDTAPRS
ncbi:hypothetical protein OG948_37945 (plasmid) [Embleya sp. NBC_00888]|uniref:hypothetical protein n=1 Tax=Embleya sp. NBC_00888 TaxID=2975960 RepID=UPI002F919BB7|nr:hypothetical protein OG948_37945 [Embleya sp. NBC_00888]